MTEQQRTQPSELWIDGRAFPAAPDRNLLDLCLSLGFDLPYFCWHPALGSVGACRQCAVKQYRNEKDERGRLVMACMTSAAPGTRISIVDPEARELRRSVIEWLMVNHPHDCPVCDEGGECHLQDMTVMNGHAYRRYRFAKRTHHNQDLGPFVRHEMNRCIQCYRCVRFYGDHAGGKDLRVFGAHDHVYFGRECDGVLESELSGNLVEICPTGVFTDRTLGRHPVRKWDLQSAPSVCVHCSLGCNTTPGERYGTLRRIRARYHGEVNGHFLCDRGRYGYEFVNHDRRLRRPLLPRGTHEDAVAIERAEAVARLGELVARRERVLGIGSPRASLEGNFALRRLVGPDRFCCGLDRKASTLTDTAVRISRQEGAHSPSLAEVARCDAVLVLGEDVTQTAPMLGLALRQAAVREPRRSASALGIPDWHDAAMREVVQGRRGPFFVATPDSTRLDELARATRRAPPEEIARLGFAVAHRLDQDSPEVRDLDPGTVALAEEIAEQLVHAERPLVVSGTSCASVAVLEAAANVARALRHRRRRASDLCLVLPECNSAGLALLGGVPLESALDRVEAGEIDTLLILENDLQRRARADVVDRLLSARHVVVLDHLAHATGARAELLLPVGTFAESDGTLVSQEGRAQRFFQVFVPEGEVRESWRWLRDGMQAAGRTDAEWPDLDAVVATMAQEVEALRDAGGAAPPAASRWAQARIPREPHRYSGRTAMHADLDVNVSAPPEDPDTPLSFSMEGFDGRPPARLASDFWWPRWNSVQALHRFQEEVDGPLRGGDPGVRLYGGGAPGTLEDGGYTRAVPEPFAPREGHLRVVPAHHVFGSEELSTHAQGIAELSPEPYVGLGPEDAAELGVDGPRARLGLLLGAEELELPVRVRPGLPRSVATLPVGLEGLPGGSLPTWARVRGAAR